MKTGLTKKQKVTEVFYNAKDPTAEIYTHDAKLKKRLSIIYRSLLHILMSTCWMKTEILILKSNKSL